MTETAVIEQPKSEEMLATARNIVEVAKVFIVNDGESYGRAGEIMRAIKTGIDDVKQQLAPAKKQTDAAHKAIVKLEKDAIGPRQQARDIYSEKRTDWRDAAERKRRAEEERLRTIEMKLAEDARLAEAARLEAEGRKEQADAVIAAPIVPKPVVLRDTVPKSEGVSVRTNWHFRIVNVALIPPEWMIPDQGALGAYARSRRESAVGSVPGVEFYSEQSEAVSAHR